VGAGQITNHDSHAKLHVFLVVHRILVNVALCLPPGSLGRIIALTVALRRCRPRRAFPQAPPALHSDNIALLFSAMASFQEETSQRNSAEEAQQQACTNNLPAEGRCSRPADLRCRRQRQLAGSQSPPPPQLQPLPRSQAQRQPPQPHRQPPPQPRPQQSQGLLQAQPQRPPQPQMQVQPRPP